MLGRFIRLAREIEDLARARTEAQIWWVEGPSAERHQTWIDQLVNCGAASDKDLFLCLTDDRLHGQTYDTPRTVPLRTLLNLVKGDAMSSKLSLWANDVCRASDSENAQSAQCTGCAEGRLSPADLIRGIR